MWRFEGGRFQEEAYSLPEEERFLLLVNGRPWASFSYTPGDEVYLALGHLFLSGVLSGLEGVRWLVGEGVVAVDLPGDPERGVGVRDSGCAAGLRYGEPRLSPLPKVPLDPELPLELMAQLRQHAVRYARTRGIHGAALFDLSGRLLYVNEDIGRHNAVDRLAGYMLLEGVRPPVLLAVTGRVSQEMAGKAIGMGAVLLASRTGATLPAVNLARHYGLALAAYVRPTGYRLYAPGGMPVPEGVLRP
ncbi:formate dehydrogenase accessory sulfurtransferase FdhD [Thermus antranikianii]|uniref:Sufurtransferase FdhD n=1 Tax=Thermus antranikianii TaxID=88190 RepID=A0ABY7RQ51_9DEIN|nr:formate dehydrogenase accessory sulfurtransferase FdhD [Thermus antranikianii]WCM39814.1 sufurtransferase FdhD [Thermus antranikianii]